MEIVIEILLWIVVEILTPVSADFFVESKFGGWFDRLAERATLGSILTFAIYASLGLIIGCLSLFVLPESLIRSQNFHGISLIVSPLAAGSVMLLADWLRQPSNQQRWHFSAFAHAFVLAFCMALVRFLYAL